MIYQRSFAVLLAAACLSDAIFLPESQQPQRPLLGNFDSYEQNVAIQDKGELLEIDSKSLQGDISTAALLESAKDLFKIAELSLPEYNHPTRVIGSAGHASTLDYIHSTLSSLTTLSGESYYSISNQTFPAVVGEIYSFRLVLGTKVPTSAHPMSLTPPTPKKEPVFAPLVHVDKFGCDASNYPKNVTGAIAVIMRGQCSFGDKSSLAGQAGAVAAVVYNNEEGPLSGTLGIPDEHHIATFAISRSDIMPILESLKDGETVEGSAYVDALVGTIQTINIVAQTRDGDQDNCVMLGGHTDSVTEGPGINDDGSGTLTLLEVAKRLSKYKVNNCVRFGWWAGEEEGLLGSDYYVSQLTPEENMKIRLFMDYDMLASPNYAYQVYNATDAANPVGSQKLRDLYVDWYEEHGLNHTYIPFDGRSDYDAFIKNGIPGGGIATGAEGIKTKKEQAMFGGMAGEWYDHCYHQLCDTVDNLNLAAWEVNAKLVAHSVATFAKSFDGFPKRKLEDVTAASKKSQQFKYHGSKLVM